MIFARMFENERSLEKDEYKKSFDVSYDEKGLKEMLSKIKVKDDIVVFVDNDTLYCKIRFSKDFQGIRVKKKEEVLELNEKIVKQDLKALYEGITDYAKYSVKSEWQSVLGKIVYLVKDRELQRNIIDKQDVFAFMPEDLSELVEGLKRNSEIPQKVLLKCFFDGKEIANVLATQEGR